MRGKFATAVLSVLTITTITITGCGSSFPELTDEEYDQTVQYAAGLLMRYSNNAVEKLIYVNPDKVELDDEEEKSSSTTAKSTKTSNAATAATSKEVIEKPEIEEDYDLASSEKSTDDEAGKEASNKAGADSSTDIAGTDISIADVSVEGASEETDTQESTASASTASSQTTSSSGTRVLSYSEEQELMDGLYLRYNGYYVTSSYPENARTMVIEASSGKRLLVFSFRVVNESGSDKYLDMVSLNPYFQISINGTNLGYTSVTMLDNDLSTFAGTIAAGESKTLVLVKEIDASLSKNIDSLELTITMNGQSQTVVME